jgi:hypothetical protein
MPKELHKAFQQAGDNDFYSVNPIRPNRVFEHPKISANEVAKILHYKEGVQAPNGAVWTLAVMKLKSRKFLTAVVQSVPGIEAAAATWRVADDYPTAIWYGLHPANRTSLGLDGL